MSVETYILDRQYKKRRSDYEDIDSDIKIKILEAVKEKISETNDITMHDFHNAKIEIKKHAIKWIEDELIHYSNIMFNHEVKYEIYDLLIQNLFGFGVIEPLINDKDITEIMINGTQKIFVEKKGMIALAKDKRGKPITFTSEVELKQIIDKIVAPINRKVDESNPIVDARLPDGSRVNIVLNPIALDGTSVTIRKFPDTPYNMSQLVNFQTLSIEAARLLEFMVKAKYNILVSGGTGSGKTTFLNALSLFIPHGERVITIEDSAELKFVVDNMIRMETRPPNIENKGAIDIRDLVKSSLRMRPDRIVVGEIRAGEALDMLQAMNTGHDGSLSTGHANSSDDMLLRLETMVLMAGMELPVSAIRKQIASAVDIIVHISKLRDGSRRAMQITEILGVQNGEIKTRDIYKFRELGFDQEKGKIQGELYKCEALQQVNKFLLAGISEDDLFTEKEKMG